MTFPHSRNFLDDIITTLQKEELLKGVAIKSSYEIKDFPL